MCGGLLASYHSYVILYLRDVLDREAYLSSLGHMHFSTFTLLSSVSVLSSLLFPLCVLYIRHRSEVEQGD